MEAIAQRSALNARFRLPPRKKKVVPRTQRDELIFTAVLKRPDFG